MAPYSCADPTGSIAALISCLQVSPGSGGHGHLQGRSGPVPDPPPAVDPHGQAGPGRMCVQINLASEVNGVLLL